MLLYIATHIYRVTCPNVINNIQISLLVAILDTNKAHLSHSTSHIVCLVTW